MITLQNLSARLVVLTLPHGTVCTEEACGCSRQVTGVTDHDPKTGVKTVRAVRRKLADSITLTAAGTDGDTVEGLPLGVARLEEVLLMERRREIRVVRHANEAAMEREAARAQEAKRKPMPSSTKAAPSAVKE